MDKYHLIKYKSWGTLKVRLKGLLCEALGDRIDYFLTGYRKAHDQVGRAAIRLDGEELVRFSWFSEHHQHKDLSDIREATGKALWLGGHEEDPDHLRLKAKWAEEGTLSDLDFLCAALAYLDMPVTDALESDDPIVRIFAAMDRRIGKRTLRAIRDRAGLMDLPPWARQFYELRFAVDGIDRPDHPTKHHHRGGASHMIDGATPDPNRPFPLRSGSEAVTYVKPTIRRDGIVVGEFTYYAGTGFEERVTHHYDFIGDQLIIGKFCQIGAGVEFVMGGANHQMDALSTFPFYIMEGWEQEAPPLSEMPLKGDTVVGNDVWIGQGATILPGVHIGDGAIIGMKSVVGSDVPPYAIVVGAPARQIRKRFDDDLIELMLRLRWWDRPVEEIQRLIPILTCSDPERVRAEIRALLEDGPGR